MASPLRARCCHCHAPAARPGRPCLACSRAARAARAATRPPRPSRPAPHRWALCIDCAAVIGRNTLRCRACKRARVRASWVCLDCGQPRATRHALRCRPCAVVFRADNYRRAQAQSHEAGR